MTHFTSSLTKGHYIHRWSFAKSYSKVRVASLLSSHIWVNHPWVYEILCRRNSLFSPKWMLLGKLVSLGCRTVNRLMSSLRIIRRLSELLGWLISELLIISWWWSLINTLIRNLRIVWRWLSLINMLIRLKIVRRWLSLIGSLVSVRCLRLLRWSSRSWLLKCTLVCELSPLLIW